MTIATVLTVNGVVAKFCQQTNWWIDCIAVVSSII